MPFESQWTAENSFSFGTDDPCYAGGADRVQKVLAAEEGVVDAGVYLATGQATAEKTVPATQEFDPKAIAKTQADVGRAVGTGTDIAIEAIDVVPLSGDWRGVVNAFDIGKNTMANIRQYLFWTSGYKFILIPVAAGTFYTKFGTLLPSVLAAGAMAMSSVFFVSHALRLQFFKPVLESK